MNSAVLPEDTAHGIGNLAQRSQVFHRLDDNRHQVGTGSSCLLYPLYAKGSFVRITIAAQLTKLFHLNLADGIINREMLVEGRFFHRIAIDADDDSFSTLWRIQNRPWHRSY